jgi:hypothetical protein
MNKAPERIQRVRRRAYGSSIPVTRKNVQIKEGMTNFASQEGASYKDYQTKSDRRQAETSNRSNGSKTSKHYNPVDI